MAEQVANAVIASIESAREEIDVPRLSGNLSLAAIDGVTRSRKQDPRERKAVYGVHPEGVSAA